MPTPDPVERTLSPEPFLSRFYTFRRIADNLSRKIGRSLGRPDNSPWVMRPGRGKSAGTYVDFIFGLDYLSPNATLVRLLQKAFAPYGLSLLLANDRNVESVTRDVARGWIRPHVYLDLCSTLDKRFLDLLKACAGQGSYPLADPNLLASCTFKAELQSRLEGAGLSVPPTVIFRAGEPDRDLTPEEVARIGERCVAKPSKGAAARGVAVGIAPTATAIGKARDFDRSDDWLVQKMMTWGRCGPRAAYLRAYHVFGHRSLLWWAREDGLDKYERLTWSDVRQYDLLGAVELIDRLADLIGLDYFSTEIAITADSGPGRFVLIDYVNDQCDMDPDPGPGKRSVPEEWVAWACARIAEFVWRKKHQLETAPVRSLWLPD